MQTRSATRRDASLVQRIADGDEAAVALLYQEHADAVFGFIHRRVHERFEDAQEITQDTFLSALSLSATYDGSCEVRTWLCGISKVHIAGYYRRQGRLKRIPSGQVNSTDESNLRVLQESEAAHSPAEEAMNRMEAVQLVDSMMAALTPDEREALLLRHVDGFSVREIAAMLQRTEKAVEHVLARTRRKAAETGADWIGEQK